MSVANDTAERGGRGALLVAAGILASRLFGFVRLGASSHFLGTSPQAAALAVAMKIPNFLQNLFGEGVLSASFIPVYARLIAEGAREEAERVAGAIFGLLALVVSILVAVGIVAAPSLVALIAPGLTGETRALTVLLVRI